MRKNQFLKVKVILLELEKNFIEFKGIEDIEVKIKREIKQLFFKPKDTEEVCVVHSTSDYIKFTPLKVYNDAYKAVNELFESLC